MIEQFGSCILVIASFVVHVLHFPRRNLFPLLAFVPRAIPCARCAAVRELFFLREVGHDLSRLDPSRGNP